MFHSAAVKLTLWYLAIIMGISFIFSLSLYQVSSNDLGRTVNRQIEYFSNVLGPEDSFNYTLLRQRQLSEDLNHLKTNLVLFNLLVLIGGGAASYWLARRTLKPIEESLHSQARFASDASHELRTPLTVIQTENEVALRNKTLTKLQAVNIIKSNLEEVAKLKALSEGLLRLAKGSGRIENPVSVPLKRITRHVIDSYEKAASEKKIKITNKVSNLYVLGDEQTLSELLSVFVDNAIKYTSAGGIITLSAQKRKHLVLVQISDTGEGIEQKDLPRIFERFYRTDASRNKTDDGGYGLGLAIAKKITEAHRGHIEVSSTVGKGTIFSIFLPIGNI